MSMATVKKEKRGRGKGNAYSVKQNGQKIKTFEDNEKLGWVGARDLAQRLARKLNGGKSL